MLTNPGPQCGRRHGAAVACHFAATAQEDHGWYRLNMKARGELPFDTVSTAALWLPRNRHAVDRMAMWTWNGCG